MTRILTVSFAVLVLIFTSSIVSAGFSIPGYVYTVDRLDSARSRAENSEQPVTFVYSDKNTDCSLATAASRDIFQGLKNYSVVVYAERKDWKNLPYAVQVILNSPESGEYIPKTAVVDSGCNNMICVIPYAKTEQRRQLIEQARELLSNY